MLHIILKKARLDAKLTMEQASERVGISQSQLSRIESKKAQVSAQRLVDLAGAYGVSPSKLLDGAVVGAMPESDLDRIGQVIEFVEETLAEHEPRPSPKLIRKTVLAIFRQETKTSLESGKPFERDSIAIW